MNGNGHVNGELRVPYVLQHDPNKETELLGSLAVAPERFADVACRLHGLDFSDELNAIVFGGMLACHRDGLVPTVPRLLEKIDHKPFESQQTSPAAFLAGLIKRNDYPGNIGYLVDKVSGIGKQRRLQIALHEARIAIDHDESPIDVLASLKDVFTERQDTMPLETCDDLPEELITLDEPVIDGLLRSGESINVVGLTKRGKTWLAIYVNLCVATGTDLFGLFPCKMGATLYANCELKERTFRRRVQDVAAAMGFRMRDVAGRFAMQHLRGKGFDAPNLLNKWRAYEPDRFSLCTLDTLSRLIPKGLEENSNPDMTSIYDAIDSFADYHNNATVVIHHPTKGTQTSKQTSDIGAGAGAISRCADVHLVFREHEQPDAVAVEAVARSFPPVAPFCLRWQFPLWVLAPDLDPARLKPDRPPRPKPVEKDAEPVVTWNAEKFAAELLKPEPRTMAAIIAAAADLDVNASMAKRLLALAAEEGKAHRWKIVGSNAAHYANRPQPLLENDLT